MKVHHSFFGIFLFLALAFFSTQAAACNEACASDGDCSTSSCRYCDTDFGVCADCCEFTEQITCPSACSWQFGECRNVAGVSCGVNIPETPKSSRYWFFILLAAAGVAALTLARRLHVRTNK